MVFRYRLFICQVQHGSPTPFSGLSGLLKITRLIIVVQNTHRDPVKV
jgi:hypothetical protein